MLFGRLFGFGVGLVSVCSCDDVFSRCLVSVSGGLDDSARVFVCLVLLLMCLRVVRCSFVVSHEVVLVRCWGSVGDVCMSPVR